jgi:hypothetical protein
MSGISEWLFCIFLIYLLAQSIRGLFVLKDIRMMRWILFYALIFGVFILIEKSSVCIFSKRATAIIVTISALAYFIMYYVHGFFYEYFLYISRWEVQGVKWAGPAYALFPLVIVLPAIFLVLEYETIPYQLIGIAAYIAGVATTYYYQSRSAWLTLFALTIGSISLLKLKKYIVVLLMFVGLFFLYNWHVGIWNAISSYFMMSIQSSTFFIGKSRSSDVDRKVHIQAAFMTITQKKSNFLFGTGFYTHRITMKNSIQTLYNKRLPGAKVKDIIRTTSLAGIIVDGGILGLVLLVSNFIFILIKLFPRKFSDLKSINSILILSVCITFIWLSISYIFDIILFYLLLMPSGLFLHFAQATKNK